MKRKEYREYRRRTIERLASMGEHCPGGTYDEQGLPAYTNPNKIMRYVFWERVRVISRILDRLPEARVAIDFGAGLGLMLPFLAGRTREIIAIDVEQDKLIEGVTQLGIALDNIRLEKSLSNAMISSRQEIDLVLAMDVLEHVADLNGTLRDIARLMTPGGRLLVSGPTENLLYRLGRRLAGYSGHYHRRSIRDVEQAMLRDFRIVTKMVLFPLIPIFVILEAQPASFLNRRKS